MWRKIICFTIPTPYTFVQTSPYLVTSPASAGFLRLFDIFPSLRFVPIYHRCNTALSHSYKRYQLYFLFWFTINRSTGSKLYIILTFGWESFCETPLEYWISMAFIFLVFWCEFSKIFILAACSNFLDYAMLKGLQ